MWERGGGAFPIIDVSQQTLGLENCLVTQNVRKMQIYTCSKRTFLLILSAKCLNLQKFVFCAIVYFSVLQEMYALFIN